MAEPRDIILGVDLGGTKILVAALNAGQQILARQKDKTRAEQGSKVILKRVGQLMNDCLAEAKVGWERVRGVGLGFPGPIDYARGLVQTAPNLGMKNFPLRSYLEKELGVPVVVDNDVNLGTYGELHFGVARGLKHVIGIFPGTGIGGGLVLNGQLFRGATGGAGEIGHMIIQPDGPLCGCGQYGCVEALASRSALSRDVALMAARGHAPNILALAGTDVTRIKSKVLAEAMADGDTQVSALVHKSAAFLGLAMANAVNLLNPELIVLGGGLVEAMPKSYVKAAERAMRRHAMPHLARAVKVATAKLGDDAVAMGAAKLLSEVLDERAQVPPQG